MFSIMHKYLTTEDSNIPVGGARCNQDPEEWGSQNVVETDHFRKHFEFQMADDSNSNRQEDTGSCSEESTGGFFAGSIVGKGFAFAGVGQGLVLASIVFLNNALLFLSSEDAGCLSEKGTLVRGCTNTIYGFRPSTLISNIAVLQGLLSAFCMPVIGAIVDYTPHRKRVGQISACLLWAIQVAQIGTTSSTWFAMSVLQALAGFVFELNYISSTPYVIETADKVDDGVMSMINKNAFVLYFAACFSYTLLVLLTTGLAGLGPVDTVRVSQAAFVLMATPFMYLAWWRFLPESPARRQLPEGHFLWLEGFRQNWRTCTSIVRSENSGMRWFFVSTFFSEPGLLSMAPIGFTFLSEGLGYSPRKIALSTSMVLFAAIPGCSIGHKVSQWFDPNRSLQGAILCAMITTTGLAFLLQEGMENTVFAFGFCWGIVLGWFYTSQRLFFSLVTPKGQEAELSGFFVYCQLIISWLPPLTFSIAVSKGAPLKYALLSLLAYQFPGLTSLLMIKSWDRVLLENTANGDSVSDDVAGRETE